MEAEYVLLEVNGLFTYTYSLTAETALCHSQPQNWTTIREEARGGPYTWDREVAVTLPIVWVHLEMLSQNTTAGGCEQQRLFSPSCGLEVKVKVLQTWCLVRGHLLVPK